SPKINLPLVMLIPDYYVPDNGERLNFYRRISGIDNLKDLEDYTSELVDRFGALPEESANLIYGVRLKILAMGCGIGHINIEGSNLVISPYDGLRINTKDSLIHGKEGVRVSPYRIQLDIIKLGAKWRGELESLLRQRISLF
ncbi:MAG: hypothetical protein PHS35_03735, partial [Dehalococcoidales bacterium]|nr:hypothetical protein [Dehalococcoidales bacterium]